MESDLSALLKPICPRVYPDVAPPNVTRPYLTWQAIGGEALRYLDGTAPDKRHTLMQINAWATTRIEAINLIHAVEDAICASPAWQGTPQGEAQSTYEPDTLLYGSLQRFEIFAAR